MKFTKDDLKKYGIYAGVSASLLCGAYVAGSLFSSANSVARQEAKVHEELTNRINAEVQQELYYKTMETEVQKAQRVVDALSSEVEFILLTETGSNILKHDRDGNWFTNAEIQLNLEYTAIWALPSTKVAFVADQDGSVVVQYNPANIRIKSVDVVHHVVSTDKQWFGEAYTPQETAALVDIARDDIYNQVSSDLSYRHEAQANFENFIIKFAQNLGVSKVYFETIVF